MAKIDTVRGIARREACAAGGIADWTTSTYSLCVELGHFTYPKVAKPQRHKATERKVWRGTSDLGSQDVALKSVNT